MPARSAIGLLVDEILSVGDFAFQKKSLARIESFLARGATVILVSHATRTVRELCQHAIWLEDGHLVADGPAAEVVDAFLAETVPAALPPHAADDAARAG